jgi:threonyl-tRNA synthetase
VAVRKRGQDLTVSMDVLQFIDSLRHEIESRSF